MFLQSPEWQRVRKEAYRKNRQHHGGRLVCEACGQTEGVMCADHILPRKYYPALALAGWNLQILCAECNKKKGNAFSDDFRRFWHYPLQRVAVWLARGCCV